MNTTRMLRTVAIGGALTLGLASPAAAHITVDPAEAPADGFATINFQVPHGCEESPTTRLRIQIPPSVPSVTPGRSPFYDLTTKEGKKDKVELHGETITRGVSEVIYTAKVPLPPHDLDVIPMSMKLPAGQGGTPSPSLSSRSAPRVGPAGSRSRPRARAPTTSRARRRR